MLKDKYNVVVYGPVFVVINNSLVSFSFAEDMNSFVVCADGQVVKSFELQDGAIDDFVAFEEEDDIVNACRDLLLAAFSVLNKSNS